MTDEMGLVPAESTEGSELAAVDASQTLQVDNLLMNTKALGMIHKIATRYANSSMVPTDYVGKPDNCFVACEMATRMGVSPMFVMQNMFVVRNRPTWSGQACIALINGCGLFDEPLEYMFVGDSGKSSFGCYAQTKRKGKLLRGTTITIQMAIDEKWMEHTGSKWKTMPEQMLMYRAAAFFARVHCPNVLMGFQLVDEVRDVEQEEKKKVVVSLEGNSHAE